MPPRLVSEVEGGSDIGLGSDSSIPFFTEEELQEIESVSDDLNGTANGFDRIDDPSVRELIERSGQGGLGKERTESRPFGHLAETSSDVQDVALPGRPTDSSDFPVYSRADGAEHRVDRTEEHSAPSAGFPDVVAREIRSEAEVDDHDPGTDTGRPGFGAERPPLAKTMMLENSGMLSSRAVLEAFVQECQGALISGIFSFDDGLALDFVSTSSSSYEKDTLSAFFRDVTASAESTAGAFSGESGFSELQISLSEETILLRRIDATPYIHITVVSTQARLGIVLVLMRRYGQKLTECFTR